jgi:hypothetical protein
MSFSSMHQGALKTSPTEAQCHDAEEFSHWKLRAVLAETRP